MPTYTYKREDNTTFEIEQRITADPLKTCPTTGQKVKRIISGGAGLVFKGSGFYLTDYARSGNGDAKKDGKTQKAESKTSESSTSSEKSSSSSTDNSSSTSSSKD